MSQTEEIAIYPRRASRQYLLIGAAGIVLGLVVLSQSEDSWGVLVTSILFLLVGLGEMTAPLVVFSADTISVQTWFLRAKRSFPAGDLLRVSRAQLKALQLEVRGFPAPIKVPLWVVDEKVRNELQALFEQHVARKRKSSNHESR